MYSFRNIAELYRGNDAKEATWRLAGNQLAASGGYDVLDVWLDRRERFQNDEDTWNAEFVKLLLNCLQIGDLHFAKATAPKYAFDIEGLSVCRCQLNKWKDYLKAYLRTFRAPSVMHIFQINSEKDVNILLSSDHSLGILGMELIWVSSGLMSVDRQFEILSEYFIKHPGRFTHEMFESMKCQFLALEFEGAIRFFLPRATSEELCKIILGDNEPLEPFSG